MIENNNFDKVDNIQHQISQVDYPQIDNFLKNGFSNDTKIIIDNVFNANPDLKDSFESFLKMASLQDKMVCKRHLLDAKDGNEIKNIIMENMPGGCKIVETVLPSSFDNSITDILNIREEEQNNKEEEQNNKEEEQNNKEEEQNNKEEEQNNKEEEQNNKEEEQQNIENNQGSTDIINILRYYEDAIRLRENLIAGYPTLDDDTKQGSKAYEDTKNLLKDNGTLDKLANLGIDQNGYISLITTINVAQSNPEYQTLCESQDFSLLYIAMKNLNNACNIPDTSFDSFTENNIANTRTELFHETIGNKGLIEQRQRNIETHSSDYERLFSIESDDELIQNYGRFLDGNGKKLMEKWLRNPTSLSGDENDNLMNFVLFEQKEIEDKTKNMVEELCMTSQVKGFLSCIPKEYANQFQFNKANEIHVDQNGILQLDGHIKGVNFSLRQNTNDVNARLQMSTTLYKDQDNNLDFKGKYKNSPFILPTSSQVFDTALSSLQSENLSKIQNQDDYFDALQDSILKSIDKLYSNTQYTHHYVESQIRSEETINETIGIFQKIGGGNIETLSTVGDSKVYDFFDTLEFNLSVMTNKEKTQFEECLQILGEKITEGGNIAWSDWLVKDKNLAKLLGSKKETQKQIKGLAGGNDENSFFDFFEFFFSPDERSESGNRQVLNLNKLSKCLKDEAYARDLWEDSEWYRSKLDSQFDIGFEG